MFASSQPSRSAKRFAASLVGAIVFSVGMPALITAEAVPYGYVQATCPNIVKQALDTVSAQCGKTARGKLCYGNSTITAQFQPGVSNVKFQAPGDTVDVSALKQFTLGGMDTASSNWGVAEMKIKADLPDADPSQAVTMILFGDVQLSDASSDANAAVLTQTPGAMAQQNQYATATTRAIDTKQTQIAATATKIAGLEATATAHALTPTPTGTTPAAKATQSAATATQLANIIDTATAAPIPQTLVPGAVAKGPYSGLQAFYFQSSDTAPCDQAPHDGILIQSPQGSKQRVTLSVDGVTISLGSTVYITAQPGKFLTVNTLEGSAIVITGGQGAIANAGQSVQVPLDTNLRPSGAPKSSGLFKTDVVRGLPTQVLPINTLPFITGLPSDITFTVWTRVETVTSGNCTVTKNLTTYTSKGTIAYNGSNLWYGTSVFTKTSPGTYVGTTIGVDTPYQYTDQFSMVVINSTTISGTISEKWSFGGICTYSISLTADTPTPTATL